MNGRVSPIAAEMMEQEDAVQAVMDLEKGGWNEDNPPFPGARLKTKDDFKKSTKPKGDVYEHIYEFIYPKGPVMSAGWGCNYCTHKGAGRPIVQRIKAHLGAVPGYQVAPCPLVSTCTTLLLAATPMHYSHCHVSTGTSCCQGIVRLRVDEGC